MVFKKSGSTLFSKPPKKTKKKKTSRKIWSHHDHHGRFISCDANLWEPGTVFTGPKSSVMGTSSSQPTMTAKGTTKSATWVLAFGAEKCFFCWHSLRNQVPNFLVPKNSCKIEGENYSSTHFKSWLFVKPSLLNVHVKCFI